MHVPHRIDEIHMMVGAGAGSKAGGSGLDISNLLKPPLARGELQCIGATTLDEHRKYIEKDAALERRFQPVMVAEPTQAETLEILHGLQVTCLTALQHSAGSIAHQVMTLFWYRLPSNFPSNVISQSWNKCFGGYFGDCYHVCVSQPSVLRSMYVREC